MTEWPYRALVFNLCFLWLFESAYMKNRFREAGGSGSRPSLNEVAVEVDAWAAPHWLCYCHSASHNRMNHSALPQENSARRYSSTEQ